MYWRPWKQSNPENQIGVKMEYRRIILKEYLRVSVMAYVEEIRNKLIAIPLGQRHSLIARHTDTAEAKFLEILENFLRAALILPKREERILNRALTRAFTVLLLCDNWTSNNIRVVHNLAFQGIETVVSHLDDDMISPE
jgi:hypothetical protein